MSTPREIAANLKAEAARLGFDRVGITAAVTAPGHSRLLSWLAAGHHGGLEYMERQAAARAHPESILEGVRTIVLAARSYHHGPGGPDPEGHPRIGRYARGRDYHVVMWRQLDNLADWLVRQHPEARARTVSDTAPLPERDLGRLAGLGWIGKNTMLLNPEIGSYFVLGALLTDLEIEPDEPFLADHCGTCTRCLDACPTDALVQPGVLDSRRCISAWTIEHRGPLSVEMVEQLHGWVFGCDICQEVCPWNQKARPAVADDLAGWTAWSNPEITEWFGWSERRWAMALQGTALRRAKRQGLLRNAAAVLASEGGEKALGALLRGLGDADAVIRDACAQGLARWADRPEVRAQLEAARDREQESWVRDRIAAILGEAIDQGPATTPMVPTRGPN